MDENGDVRLTAWVRGRVQGVGFRWWVRARALELGLVGSATNLRDGRVEVVAEGPRDRCELLLDMLGGDVARDARSPADGAAGDRADRAADSGEADGAALRRADHPPRPGRVTGVTERWSTARGAGAGFSER